MAKHPGNHKPGGSFTFTKKLVKTAEFQEQLKTTYDSYSELKQLRKREQEAKTKPLEVTPTQSPLQKTGRLQSVVMKVQKDPAEQPQDRHSDSREGIIAWQRQDGTFLSAPHHLIGVPPEVAKVFVTYCTNRFGRDDFIDELGDFGNDFDHRTIHVTQFCMANVVYFKVSWVRDEQWVFPIIPPEIQETTSQRGATPPAPPTLSRRRVGEDVAARCLKWWRYFCALIQFWKDETTPFQYGGVVCYDSKVLLYVMFRLKAVLRTMNFKFHHYTITTWNDFATEHLTSDQITLDCKCHQKTHDKLCDLKLWMQDRYMDEADMEFDILRRLRGDIDRVHVNRSDRNRHPGNEGEYRRQR